MKELTVISGKGGTGKTSITAAFASLAKSKVIADCDVDAADLHLILKPEIKYREGFYGGKIAYINKDLCIECDKCREVCQFDAINKDYIVDSISCEGCSVCVHFCPVNAIDFREHLNGEWFISNTRFGQMVHAKLGVAEENSGKLVSLVRQQAKLLACENDCDYLIVDGAPGIGCPVISSITGADAVLIVTEPTLSGLHDLRRVVQLSSGHFHIPTFVCINKYDLNIDISNQIEKFCQIENVNFAGRICYDKVVTQAMVQGQSVVEFSNSDITKEIKKIWNYIENKLKVEN